MIAIPNYQHRGSRPRPVGGDRPGLSVADKRRLQELLHQQMWCWGRDVLNPFPPNLLVHFGMTRHGSDDPDERGSNRYSIDLAEGGVLSLWAFGVAIVEGDAGVFLHRYLRGVRVLPQRWCPVGVRRPEQLPRLPRPASPRERERSIMLFDRLLRWIERYEREVLGLLGPAYRDRTLKNWEHLLVPGPAMADEWRRIAGIYRRASTTQPAFQLPPTFQRITCPTQPTADFPLPCSAASLALVRRPF